MKNIINGTKISRTIEGDLSVKSLEAKLEIVLEKEVAELFCSAPFNYNRTIVWKMSKETQKYLSDKAIQELPQVIKGSAEERSGLYTIWQMRTLFGTLVVWIDPSMKLYETKMIVELFDEDPRG